MNINLEDLKTISKEQLDKSDTPSDFLLNLINAVYDKGYSDGTNKLDEIRSLVAKRNEVWITDGEYAIEVLEQIEDLVKE